MVDFSKSEKTAANEKFFCVDCKYEHIRGGNPNGYNHHFCFINLPDCEDWKYRFS